MCSGNLYVRDSTDVAVDVSNTGSITGDAAATVLSYLFLDRATEVSGWVTQAGLSRMYAGIHYRFDIDSGQALGNNVGRLTIARDQNPGLLAAIH